MNDVNLKKILVIQPLKAEALGLFEERPDVRYEIVTDFSEENLLALIGDADAITVRDAPVPVSVVEAGRRLKVISRHGVGYDNIPIDYCTSRGIPVTVVGDVNAVSVAEQMFFLLLAAARAGVQLDEAVRLGNFSARSKLIGVELRGRVLLIIGFGRIGREVASRAAAFGMRVLVFDPYADPATWPDVEFAATLVSGLVQANVVSVHVPLSSATKNLISASEIRSMPPGGIIINTARGGIVDELALLDGLRTGHLRAAGLDTFEQEPLPISHPLLAEKRVVLAPHSAALTEESLSAMGLVTARNALAGLDDALDPKLVVNRSVLEKPEHAH